MPKHAGGRPTDYKPDYARQALVVIEESGFSIPKLMRLFDCGKTTIYRWMDDHPKFRDAIRAGRKTYEGIKIHRALAKSATGYRYTESVSEWDDKEKKMIVVKRTSKQQPPNVHAIKHWQVNMDPDNWKDRKHVDGNLTIGQAIAELEEEGRPTPEDENES